MNAIEEQYGNVDAARENSLYYTSLENLAKELKPLATSDVVASAQTTLESYDTKANLEIV